MKFTNSQNAPNCRALARDYLQCRMDNQLMDELEWETLGLLNLPETDQSRKKAKEKLEKT